MTTASGPMRANYTTSQRDYREPVARGATTDADPLRGGRGRVPRTRGALSGIALVVLGAWGALIPFIGPYFTFGLAPNQTWYWTSARGWLEVLPGAAAFVGGVLLAFTASRAVANLGAWLAILAGAWFVVGLTMQSWLNIGSPGDPLGSSEGKQMLEMLALFYGVGALILYIGATAFGRLSVRTVRDVRAAQAREARAAAAYEGEPVAMREGEPVAMREGEAVPMREQDETLMSEWDQAAMREPDATERDEAAHEQPLHDGVPRDDMPPADENPTTNR